MEKIGQTLLKNVSRLKNFLYLVLKFITKLLLSLTQVKNFLITNSTHSIDLDMHTSTLCIFTRISYFSSYLFISLRNIVLIFLWIVHVRGLIECVG